jgi:hypothetical protein
MTPVSAGFFLGVLFYPEDGNNMFFRNVGLSPKYTALLNNTRIRIEHIFQMASSTLELNQVPTTPNDRYMGHAVA